MGRFTRIFAVAAGAAALIMMVQPNAAMAHDEREAHPPDGSGHVPAYRSDGPTLLVCEGSQADFAQRVADFPAELKASNLALFSQCQRDGYRHIQDAVDHVDRPGMIIKILPGTYQEQPSLAPPAGTCANLPARHAALGYQVLSWEQQVACPHNQNLIAVFGKKDLQIEGTGARPQDVVIDAQYQRLNALRADRSSGIYLRNFTAERSTFNAVYIMESDGFVIDRLIGRWNDEYGFLTFADDHGVYTGCEAYGNGDSGIYPGAASDINAHRGNDVIRYAIEIHHCYSHHNLLGYSGTAGDSVWAHDNVFTDNTVGVATDSAFPDHPGLPQNHALFERNVIGDNNQDYYRYVRDGTCAKPYPQRGYEQGVVCPSVGVPAGTGVINPGGDYNIWRDNWVYGNHYAGFVTNWVPGFVRNDNRFAAQFDTSHHNRYFGNHLGVTPDGGRSPNGMDFWWDGQGVGSCWQAPTSAGSEPIVLPECGADNFPAGLGTARYVAEPGKLLKLYTCSEYSLSQARIPVDCDWFGARGLGRIEVKWAFGEAVLLALVLLAMWLRLLRGAPDGGDRPARGWLDVSFVSLLLALAGLIVGVFGTAYEGTPLTAAGLALLGLGWLGYGLSLRRSGRSSLGWLTVALAVFALLGAVDRGLVMIPLIPVPPSLVRILLEVLWVPWTLIAVLRGPVPTGPTAATQPATEPATPA